jgi:uncharacterized protein YdeI (YjbR/CyaY-like superfamily)
MSDTAERVEVDSRAAWRTWLEANHTKPDSIWLVTWKKGDPRHLPYDAVVEEALCFGWVDSLPRKLDDTRSMLRLSPRKPGSGWSALNKARVDKMQVAGLMAPAGLAVIAAAQADGSWSLLDAVDALAVPDDLAAALDAAGAGATFAAFPPSARRGILEWIVQAKRPETRAARIAETAAKAAIGERANQWAGRRP